MSAISVKDGQKVCIEYEGKLEDGTVFDSTIGTNPFEFKAGSKDIIEGLNEAVKGMRIGERKIINLAPKLAFGDYDPCLLVKVSTDKVPRFAKEGDYLNAQDAPKGRYWKVKKLTSDFALLDGNHPLAGRNVTYTIEVLGCTP